MPYTELVKIYYQNVKITISRLQISLCSFCCYFSILPSWIWIRIQAEKMNADPRGSGYPPPLSVIVHFQSMTETLLLVPTITYLVWPVLWSSDNLGPNYKPQQSWQKKFLIFSRRKKTCDTFFVFVDILVEVGTHVVSCSILLPRAKMEARQCIQNSNKIVE